MKIYLNQILKIPFSGEPIIYGIQNPTRKDFFARTTPFGLSPNVYSNSTRRDYTIGTKVTLDTVFPNAGSTDRWGYNTHLGPDPLLDYYHNPRIPDGQNDTGNTYTTTAWYSQNIGEGINLNVENGDTIILKRYKKLWVSGTNFEGAPGDTLHFKIGSTLILEHNAEIFQCFRGQIIRDSLSTIVWNNQSCIRSFANSGASFTGGDHTVNNGGFMVIDGSATLTLGDNTTLTFDGATTFLKLDSNSNVKLGQNSKIVFKNGAYLRANGATFTSSGSGVVWDGLVFENSGLDSIANCTFSNAKTSITIKNDSVSLANNNNNIIIGNTFNISQTNGRGIDARNVFNLLLDNNTFGFTGGGNTVGVYFRNVINGSSYSLNIINNDFEDGYLPLYLSCLAAERTTFYVYNNEFEGENEYSIACLKISGDIKENIFSEANPNSSIGLWNCNANIFRNTIHSVSNNIYLNYSFPNISPLRNEYYQNVWRGGRNEFESVENENILILNSLPDLQMGKNKFAIDNNSSFHLDGSLTDTASFRMQYNCWGNPNDTAKFHLYKYLTETTLKTICAVSVPKWCDPSLDFQMPSIISKGNGIYDTIQITEDVLEYIDDDEALLIQARSDFRREHYPDAITNYKGLIDNYAYSGYLFTSLSELDDCYKYLDTTEDETIRDVLYGDFKNYLEDKILSNDYDTTFEEVAFEYVLMCVTNMKDYDIALTGYEFMALYHPDAEQRMLASWDYEDISELLGEGEGSGKAVTSFKLRVTSEEQERIDALKELREFRRLNKKINDDPVLKRMKSRYEKTIIANKQRQEKAITTNTLNSKLDERAKLEQSEKLISRAKDNIMRGRYFSKEEKETKRLEDMRILFSEGKTELQTDGTDISLPETYSLSQNYPNPFNPTTTISYSLPKAGLVNITVYDITGKEVAGLVNEFKEAGSYDVIFTASNLSSGIYFYRLRADGFTDTKKMVVIK